MGSVAERRAEWVTAAPSPALRPFIDRYVGYRLAGFPGGLHRGLPSRHMTLIVGIGATVDVVAQADPRQAPGEYGFVLSGLHAGPVLVAHDGNQEGVAIELTPLGFRALFGMPARELWSTTVECSDVAGPAGGELRERVQGETGWRDRFVVCDEVLGRRVARDRSAPAELQGAWMTLVGSWGTAEIGAVADEVGWSRQHLARRFRDEFGLGPKLAARVLRFERARRMLQSVPSFVTIAQVAATCGYYDQAHLNRDFVEFAGCSPTRFLAEEALPSFQDDDAGDV